MGRRNQQRARARAVPKINITPAKGGSGVCLLDLKPGHRRWPVGVAEGAAVRIGRANREMADLIDKAAVGDSAGIARSSGNVVFTLMCLAQSQGFDLWDVAAEALEVNKNCEWAVDAWGRGTKIGDGLVEDSPETRAILQAVSGGAMSVGGALSWLRLAGANMKNAVAFLVEGSSAVPADFTPDSPVCAAGGL